MSKSGKIRSLKNCGCNNESTYVVRYTVSDESLQHLYQAHNTDAGFDIVAAEDVEIGTGDTKVVSTGLRLKMPKNLFCIVKSRSGLAVKYGIDVGAGVIDPDYTGEIKVVLFCHKRDVNLSIKKGDRIAQLLFIPRTIVSPVKITKEDFEVIIQQVEENNSRGNKGFGSSGV